jgi:hypothetical protein
MMCNTDTKLPSNEDSGSPTLCHLFRHVKQLLGKRLRILEYNVPGQSSYSAFEASVCAPAVDTLVVDINVGRHV